MTCKFSCDSSLETESLHKQLIDKRTSVSARVTLGKDGNLLKIVAIQVI